MLALLSALLASCRPFCGLKTDAWSVRCSWASCGECAPCPAAPTPPPPSPTADCKRYCNRLTHPLARRCNWNGCGGCSECYSAPPAPPLIDEIPVDVAEFASGDMGSGDMGVGSDDLSSSLESPEMTFLRSGDMDEKDSCPRCCSCVWYRPDCCACKGIEEACRAAWHLTRAAQHTCTHHTMTQHR